MTNYLSFFVVTEENYDAFCLAYMFTYRDFEGGTLGLAWTGDMKNAGGVCERNGVSSSTPVNDREMNTTKMTKGILKGMLEVC